MALQCVAETGWADATGKDDTFALDDTYAWNDADDVQVFLTDWFGTPTTVYYPGVRTMDVIALDAGKVGQSLVTWAATTPTGTAVAVECDVSLDGGVTWSGYQQCTSGNPIPGLAVGADASGLLLRFRQILTPTETATPSLTEFHYEIKTLTGEWVSPAIDISKVVNKSSGVAVRTATLPTGSTAVIQTRTSPDASAWSAWANLGPGDAIQSPGNNYLQVRILVERAALEDVPAVHSLTITYDSTLIATLIASGLDAAAPWRFVAYNNVLYALNGINLNKKWDGTTFSDMAGSPPTSSLAIILKNRMILAGDPSFPSRLRISDLGNTESWPVLNFIDVGRGDGDRITGLALLLDNVVVFKERSIWLLQGDSPSNYVLRFVTGDTGTVSQESIVSVKGTLGYLSRDGFGFFDGTRAVLASEKIEKTLQGLNRKFLSKAACAYWDGKCWLAVPDGISLANDVVLVFDALRTAWTVFRGMKAACWTIWRRYDEDVLVFGSSEKGQIYEADQGYSDDGAAIDSWFITKHEYFGAPERQKRLRKLLVSGSSPTAASPVLDVSLIADGGAETLSSQVTLPANGVLGLGRVIPSVLGVTTCRTLAIKGRHNVVDQGVNVYVVMVEHVLKGVR